MVDIDELQRTKTIGLIGLGDMGRLYAKRFSEAGWKICACDQESKYESLREEFKDAKFDIVRNGHLVSRTSDYIIYSVEAANIDKIVATYGPSTKVGAIVGGQTSCKAPEIGAFEKYVPSDVEIVSVHSLHGPKVATKGQPLVIINHRASDESFAFVKALMSCLDSKMVFLSAQEHDKITADTQAVTHAAFLSMGVAWKANNQYPWKMSRWVGGIENAKMNISLRIFSNKWHVYAGLAITNPSAHAQILQYASSASNLYKLMLEHRKEDLRDRLYAAKKAVFSSVTQNPSYSLLLSDDLLGQFSLGKVPPGGRTPNSHLSILAIVDSWHKSGIVPYDHMICSTPLFRIWLGVTEYLFCTEGLLDQCIEDCLNDKAFRPDDLEFVIAARNWSRIVTLGSFELYKQEFEETQHYFAHMFPEATAIGNEMIGTILSKTQG